MYVIEKVDSLVYPVGTVYAELKVALYLLPSGDQDGVMLLRKLEQRLSIDPVLGFDLNTETENSVDLPIDQFLR
jgi:hypothetical protein